MTVRDAQWWARFKAAPPELQKAMSETADARTSVEFLKRQGVSGTKLAPHIERLEDRERHEALLRVALADEGNRDDPGDPVGPIDLDQV